MWCVVHSVGETAGNLLSIGFTYKNNEEVPCKSAFTKRIEACYIYAISANARYYRKKNKHYARGTRDLNNYCHPPFR